MQYAVCNGCQESFEADEEVLSLAQDDVVIFYRYKKVVEARVAVNYDLFNQLEDNHDWVGLYVIQPEDDYE